MMNAYWTAVLGVLASLAPFLLLGAVVAGVLHILLPKDFVRRHLGGRGGVLKAVALGVPLPLCSCGVIPAGLGLKKDGASDASTVGFLISTPQTGVDSILVSASFLGLPFALFKVVSAAVTGIVGGWVTGFASDGTTQLPAPAMTSAGARRNKLRDFVDHTLMILGSIWGWVIFGILASAAIEVFVPHDFLAGFAESGSILPMIAALVISLPLYVCATASVPIAAALVEAGLPAGAALVFLMAGPATNVATIGAIYRTLGKKPLAIYLATIVLGSIGFGFMFDFVLPLDAVTAPHDHTTFEWWRVASMVALVALLAYFAVRDLRAKLRKQPEPAGAIEVAVEGMTCNGCVNTLERKLRETAGVESAHVSLDPQRAVVRGSISEEAVGAAVVAAGFRVAPTARSVEVAVEGMTCNGCVRKLERILREKPGVEDVQVTLDPQRAVVRGTIAEADVHAAVDEAGYRVPTAEPISAAS
ncbi:MAG: copper ion binding protein [Deltaproteobacteria bacterium]|jgi:copper ion binding protein